MNAKDFFFSTPPFPPTAQLLIFPLCSYLLQQLQHWHCTPAQESYSIMDYQTFAWNKMDAETLCLTKVPHYLCPGFFPLVFEALLEYIVSQGSIKGSYFLRGFTGCRMSLVLRKPTLKQ